MARYVVRACVSGDEIAITTGLSRAFGRRRALAEWQWKYQQEPEGRWIMVALDEGERVVAHCAAVPVRMQVGDLRVRAGQVVDTFALPEVGRGLGAARLYLRTVESFFASFCGPDGLAFVFAFAGERLARLALARLGCARMTPQPVSYWVRSAHRRRQLMTGHEVREGFDRSVIDELWRRSAPRYEVAAVRDGAWFGRRFTNRPGLEYVHLAAWRGGYAHAWAVVRVQPPVTRLVDLVWDGEESGALAALDAAITSGSLAVKLERVDMWLMGDGRAGEVFRRLGWEQRTQPARLAMVARSFHPEIDEESFPGRFYLTMGDSDLV